MALRRKQEAATAQSTEPSVVPLRDEPLFPPLAAPPSSARRRSWVYALGGLLALGAAAAVGVTAWLLLRGPDLQAYDEGLGDAVRLASSTQSASDAVDAPADLSQLRATLRVRRDDIALYEAEAQAVEQRRHRVVLLTALAAERRYVTELERLAGLAPPLATEAEFAGAREYAEEAEDALAAALALRPNEAASSGVELTPAPVIRVLSTARERWIQARQERARVTRLNRQRAEQLASLRAFTDQFDGIIARYSSARSELAAWIDKVNASGATFAEAYDVLAQQADRRRQLREELAGLSTPAAFAADKERVLAVMDRAVDATTSASRGISEYQVDDEGYYSSYDQTPGWQSFEQTTDEISRSYAAAIAAYQARKTEVFRPLMKKVPLPKLPRESR